MKKKVPVNIRIDQSKFENVSFDQWKSLVPDILNYDLQLSNIEKLDRILLTKLQLEAFINNRGSVPEALKDKVRELYKDQERIKQIKRNQEIAEYDSNYKKDEEEELKALEKKLSFKVVNCNQIDESKPEFLYFNNPYFIKGDNQKFDSRLPSLQQELKDLKKVIKKDLKPGYKKSKNLLDAISIDIKRILGIKNKNIAFDNLFYFVRPYIDQIINSQDFYYSELLAMSI